MTSPRPPHQPRARRRLKYALLLAAAAAIAGGAWWWRSAAKPSGPAYVTAPVTRGDVEETVLATGTLRPARLVAVGSQVSGRVLSVKHKVGDRVRKGELVAQIDSTNQENKLRTAEADLARLRAQREEKIASLRLAEQNLQRQQAMVTRNAVSRLDYDRAVAEVEMIRAQIAALDAQITSGEVAVEDARANLGYTQIVAPIDGTVLAVVTQEGQTVSAIQSAPTIVILGQLDNMAVNAQISEADVVKVKPGQKVRFSIIGEPDRTQMATLEAIEPAPESIRTDPAISSSSASSSAATSAIYYNGVFHVPNPDGRLRTYMTANAHIILGQAKDVLTVPASALQRRGRGHVVRVAGPDGKVEERRVEVGLNDKVKAEIRSGLKEGERVIVGDAADARGPGGGPPGGPMRRRPPMGL
ncbi:efflux RND transporter periplasmic adaptor subunit [Camelimonas abortus]|uniref:Efflux RND transporter periplasmic adaptor subunit n=1 Tax=Camelimonas abortus TaxID=1017184 RepID=A0ABV7LBG6_9HYPH